ncbi:MAG TPA: hypothetical protein PKK59_07880 [Anaerolineaceae bacterium]|nr:hypothetical protein [Anaerolineaceae bacterium]
MKRTLQFVVTLLFALSVVIAGSSSAQAITDWPDPFAKATAGDTEFTATHIDPSVLAGAYESVTGRLTGQWLPVNFKEGVWQFGGKALKLEGLDEGYNTQQLCFYNPLYDYGWRGWVHTWDGKDWKIMPTSTTPGSDGAPAISCATSYVDGIYALLIGYNGEVAALPVATSYECDFEFDHTLDGVELIHLTGPDIILLPHRIVGDLEELSEMGPGEIARVYYEGCYIDVPIPEIIACECETDCPVIPEQKPE